LGRNGRRRKIQLDQKNTSLIDEADAENPSSEEIDALPKKFDPMESGGSNQDYKRTQRLARHLSIDRAAQIMKERGIKTMFQGQKTDSEIMASNIRAQDRRLWDGWKGSSTSQMGKILQAATAEELGGRLRELDPRRVKGSAAIAREDADELFPDIGGYDGVKAYIRAKWETSQYLLDKADVHVVDVYRAVNLGDDEEATLEQEKVAAGSFEYGSNYTKLPKVHVVRNGASSTTTDPSVANKWDGTAGRVVLRAEVPRTAVLSIPAYGQNVHSEHEVVVAGTAWRAWDAWSQRAPKFSEVPMAVAA
jgi:hypothetical protein